ncbi:MAG: hypothetical protein HND48_23790 [Chloroflexi bacterium]|nr:hypothetical protein [Chloroflexota bacterium]
MDNPTGAARESFVSQIIDEAHAEQGKARAAPTHRRLNGRQDGQARAGHPDAAVLGRAQGRLHAAGDRAQAPAQAGLVSPELGREECPRRTMGAARS